MPEEPMTQEEILAAREWIGRGHEELSDSEIVDGVKGSLWLHSRRSNAAFGALRSAMADAMRKGLAELRVKIVRGKD